MTKPKILLFDIETQPNLAYVWQKYEQDVLAFKEEWQLLSFAYKWLGSKSVYCLTRKGQKSDRSLIQHLHALFEQADIIVAHNGDQFDVKKVKARMIYHRLAPPKPPVTVDTKKAAKTYFNFNGNSLDDLGRYLKLGQKFKHPGFDMWLGCMRDDTKSWKQMAFYNKQDVLLLERVYLRLKPWIYNHPSIAKLVNPEVKGSCPNCGSSDVEKRGLRVTNGSVQQRLRCSACGAWSHVRYAKH